MSGVYGLIRIDTLQIHILSQVQNPITSSVLLLISVTTQSVESQIRTQEVQVNFKQRITPLGNRYGHIFFVCD